MEDRQVVALCLGGDSGAFREIMDRHRGYAMAMALNMLMNREDAEDACQESFFRAFRNLDRFDPGMSFKNWFASLLYHDCLDRLRKRKRFRLFLGRFGSESSAAAASSPSSSRSNPEPIMIPSVLSRLGPKERLALYLWSREGSSGDEIAAVLGCSRNTAYVHLHRARVKLKSFLAEKKHEDL